MEKQKVRSLLKVIQNSSPTDVNGQGVGHLIVESILALTKYGFYKEPPLSSKVVKVFYQGKIIDTDFDASYIWEVVSEFFIGDVELLALQVESTAEVE